MGISSRTTRTLESIPMKIVHNTNQDPESRRDDISSTNPVLSNWLLIVGGAIIVGSAVDMVEYFLRGKYREGSR